MVKHGKKFIIVLVPIFADGHFLYINFKENSK